MFKKWFRDVGKYMVIWWYKFILYIYIFLNIKKKYELKCFIYKWIYLVILLSDVFKFFRFCNGIKVLCLREESLFNDIFIFRIREGVLIVEVIFEGGLL